MQVRRDVRLADLTTLAVGGPIDRLVEVHGRRRAGGRRPRRGRGRAAAAGARRRLQRGRTRRGLARGRRRRPQPGDRAFRRGRSPCRRARTGTAWSRYTVANGLAGIEALSGHPRLDRRDAGAERRRVRPGGRADDHRRPGVRPRREVRAHAGAGRVRVRLPRQPAQARPGRFVVLDVTFALDGERCPARSATPSWPARLGVEIGATAPLADVREAVLELRRGKGMVLDPADPDSRSAGSFFTNPIVPAAQAVEGCPSWPAGDGMVEAQRRLARAVRRLRPRHAGRPRRDVVAPQPRADDRARRDGGRAARLRRPHHRRRAGAVRRHARTANPPPSGPSSPARPCAGRPGRAGGRPSGRCSRGAGG